MSGALSPSTANIKRSKSNRAVLMDTLTKNVNVVRVRMMIVDFLFVRILINHLILSPWYHKVGANTQAPKGRAAKRVIHNIRVLASVVYMLCQALNGNLPNVSKVSGGANSGTAAANTTSLEPEASGISGFFQKLLDKNPQNFEDKMTSGSIEEKLLERRPVFTSIQDLHALLLSVSSMSAIKVQ
eukprot:gene44708-55631_t